MRFKRFVIPVIAVLLCLSGLTLCILGPDILLTMQEQSVLGRVSADNGYHQNEVDAYTGELDLYRKLLMINGIWKCESEVTTGSSEDRDELVNWIEYYYWGYDYGVPESTDGAEDSGEIADAIVSSVGAEDSEEFADVKEADMYDNAFFGKLAALYADANNLQEYDTYYFLEELFNVLKENIFNIYFEFGIIPEFGLWELYPYPQTISLYQYTDSVFGKYQFDVIKLILYHPYYQFNTTIILDLETLQILSIKTSCDNENLYEQIRDSYGYSGDDLPFTSYSQEYAEYIKSNLIPVLLQNIDYTSYPVIIHDYSDLNLAGVQTDNDEIVYYCYIFEEYYGSSADEPVYLIFEYSPDWTRVFFTVAN